jgi:hypothetical protein
VASVIVGMGSLNASETGKVPLGAWMIVLVGVAEELVGVKGGVVSVACGSVCVAIGPDDVHAVTSRYITKMLVKVKINLFIDFPPRQVIGLISSTTRNAIDYTYATAYL